MIIKCPLNQNLIESIDELAELGADEFYFGYRNDLSSDSDFLNRRFGNRVNLPSLDSAIETASLIVSKGKKAFITLNEQVFPESRHETIVEEVKSLMLGGVHGFIVSDINLLITLRSAIDNVFIVLSTVSHILNSGAVDFYLRFGINRFVLSRQLLIKEIQSIIDQSRGAVFEILVKNEECPFLEGICSFAHLPGEDSPNICRQLLIHNKYPWQGGYVFDSCGACSLFALRDYPELVLKIAGRGSAMDWLKNDVRFIKSAVSFLSECSDPRAFSTFCAEEHVRIFNNKCGRKCYYSIDYLPPVELTGDPESPDVIQGIVKFCSSSKLPILD